MVLSAHRARLCRRRLMNSAISVKGVSKRYRIHHAREAAYGTLRESISQGVLNVIGRLTGSTLQPPRFDEDFWALKNVSFDVEQGERLGVIGRNGAGKSTLLKLLSRITDPTEGRIEIRGRVSSLLEVGTGFHPELTGRENIFLNGAILGMPAEAIRRRFDEIVSFAEVEQFLDTPVKRYSSGMYVRLAFSVAAHLEPEVLIVDEVLSVGDAQFQRKCMGKMQEVNSEGRTVIFVSHNMSAVTSLCTKCVLLDRGVVKALGDPLSVTDAYYKSGFSGKGPSLAVDAHEQVGDRIARLSWARLVDALQRPIDYAHRTQRIGIQMQYEILEDGYRPVPNIHLFAQGQYVCVTSPERDCPRAKGTYVATMWIPESFLNDGVYVAGIAASNMNPVYAHFYVPEGIIFNVVDNINDPSRNDYVQAIPGLIRPKLEWQVVQGQDARGI
jgi:lipopolysaccharide transport system ATP-binding protein